MSTGPVVKEHLNKVLEHHKVVHHHAVTLARRERAARAAVANASSPEAVQLPDLEPEGMAPMPDGVDPLAGL